RCQQPRADHVATHLRHRQQHVDRLANEPQEQARAELRAHLRGEEQPPARARYGDGDATHQHDEQNSPTDAGNRVADRFEAAPEGERDERGNANQPRYNPSLFDHPPTPVPQPLSACALRQGEGGPGATGNGGYQGALISNERVNPNPIVTWSGEPRWVTIGEPATSPLSRSYSRKTCVAHCGVQR